MILAFANQKGGVAKTTTCVNLGATPGLRGHSVLLIDADPQGSLTRYLGAQSPRIEELLGDWLLGRAQFKEVVRQTPTNDCPRPRPCGSSPTARSWNKRRSGCPLPATEGGAACLL